MPLDPSVINPSAAVLQSIANPPPVPSYADIQAKNLALQNARLQSQTLQMGIQEKQNAIDQQQRALADQQAFDDIMRTGLKTAPDGTTTFDRDAINNRLTQTGRAHLLPDLTKTLNAVEESNLNLKKLRDEDTKRQQDFAQARANHEAMLGVAIKDANYDPQAAKVLIGHEVANGNITRDRGLQLSSMIDQNPDQLKPIADQLYATNTAAQDFLTGRDLKRAQQKEAEGKAAESAAKAPGEIAKAAREEYNNAIPGLQKTLGTPAYDAMVNSLSPEARKLAPAAATNPTPADIMQAGMTPAEQRTAANQAANLALRKQEVASTIQRNNLALTEFQQKYGDPLAGASPEDLARYKKIAAGDVPMPSPRSLGAQKTMNAVIALDPSYTDARYKTKQNFKTGPDANNLVQLTTALDHAENAAKNSAALGSLSLSLLTDKALSPEASRYMQDVEQYTAETGKLVKSGVLTDDEHKRLAKNMLSTRKDVRDAALAETQQLLGGKIEGIQNKYRVGTGQEIPVDEFYDKPTVDRMRRYRIGNVPAQATGYQGAGQAQPSGGPATHRYNPATGKIEAIQ